MAKIQFTGELDHILMDEVVLYNPFKKFNTWQGLLELLIKEGNAAFGSRTAKALRDRAMLLIGKRKVEMEVQRKS